ncbi:MAG: copper chaperone PCu(A)C [Gemmatimonadetes bacterium]|nr:copper chaperone PCu(A)C [Gemmatimonadota bacterium]
MASLSAMWLAVACGGSTTAIQLERAAIAAVPGVQPMVYLTVRNQGARAVSITGASVEGAATAGIRTATAHRLGRTDAALGDTALLSPVDAIPIAARASLRFAPGGYSIVLDGVARSLVPGDSLRITLRFAGAGPATTMARVVPFADLDTLLAPRPESTAGAVTEPSLDEGRALFASDGCAGCHGPAGHGDGPLARTLNPPPRDFRDAASFKNGITEEAIAQTLATGIPNGGAMPLYGHLLDRERRSLARFVTSLHTAPTPPRP